MRKIDIAHQPKDQGKATGHQKIQAAQSYPVKQRIEEYFFSADEIYQPGGPKRKYHP